jgi:raffinose/stachyose/melibiose transport system substrate-binding protein
MTVPIFRRAGVAGAVAAMMAAAALAGCSSSDSGGKPTLQVWHELTGSGNTAIDKVISDFNATSKDASAKPRQIADDQVDTVLRTGMSGPNPPDVLQYEGYRNTADYAKHGQLLDLTSWWNQHKSQFAEADSAMVKAACSYQGKVYCIPWDLYTNNQLYYNPNLLKKYHLTLPSSFADLQSIAAKLKGTGVTPVSLYAKDGWPAAQWFYLTSIQRCGVATVQSAIAKSGAKWTDPCFVKAAQDVADLSRTGVFPQGTGGSDYNAMMSLFLSGKSVFMNTGTWFEQTMADTPPSFDVKVAPFPQVDPAHPSQQLLGGVNEVFGIPAKGHHTKQALEFLDTLGTPKSGQLFAKADVMNFAKGASDSLPPRLKSAWNTAIHEADQGDNMMTYFENLLPPAMGMDTMYNQSAALASGQTTPQKFVQSLQSAAESGN